MEQGIGWVLGDLRGEMKGGGGRRSWRGGRDDIGLAFWMSRCGGRIRCERPLGFAATSCGGPDRIDVILLEAE